jgi:hypothetical protein
MTENPIKWLWDTIRVWAARETQNYLFVPFHTDADMPLVADASYFRLWLKDMNLTQSRKWFTDIYPAVHSSVRLNFGGQPDQTFARVAAPSEAVMGPGERRNYIMSELIPFNGGTVEIEAALFALRGQNHLKATVDVLASTVGILADFSNLVAAPLTEAVSIVQKLSSGLESILQTSQGQVHLALHQGLREGPASADNSLRPGYFAVILATAAQVKRERLKVEGGQLLYSPAEGKPTERLTSYEYMLFELEGTAERNDYRHLKDIAEPMNAALDAVIDGDKGAIKLTKKRLLKAVSRSPDVAQDDQRRILDALDKELKDARKRASEFGAAGVARQDLDAVVGKWAEPIETFKGLGPVQPDEPIFTE